MLRIDGNLITYLICLEQIWVEHYRHACTEN